LGYVAGATSYSAPGEALADPKDRVEIYRSLARARELLQRGEDSTGTAILTTVVRREPDLAAARRLLREYWLQRNELQKGLDWFGTAVREQPGVAALLMDLAVFQRAAGDLTGSMQSFDKALALSPQSVEALMGAAETHRAAGRMQQALELFRLAADQTSDVTPKMRIAETLMRMGHLGEAEQIVRSALSERPSLAGAHYLLAIAAEQRGDKATAEREYRVEMSIAPWDHRTPFNLAVLMGERGDYKAQVELLNRVRKVAPDFAEADLFLAKALLDLGDRKQFSEAVAAARRGLQRAPRSPQAPLAHYVLADIYALEGKKAEAARELRLGQQLERRLSAPPQQSVR
jgi:tetratricopeptide (TPR) repeat protein